MLQKCDLSFFLLSLEDVRYAAFESVAILRLQSVT
jgi:hypothetical protein